MPDYTLTCESGTFNLLGSDASLILASNRDTIVLFTKTTLNKVSTPETYNSIRQKVMDEIGDRLEGIDY